MLKQLYALVVRDELIERSTQFEEEAHLTHFSPVSHFYTPWKRQKTFGFLTFSGGIET